MLCYVVSGLYRPIHCSFKDSEGSAVKDEVVPVLNQVPRHQVIRGIVAIVPEFLNFALD